MKIIIPMAGMGKRLRPHTLTIPKPLIPIIGKPIVQRLVEDIAEVVAEPVEEVAFIISRKFGSDVEEHLQDIAGSAGARARLVYQDEPLGTAHAVLCAKESLKGKVIVAFADTLFRADFKLDPKHDGTIWVQKVEDPSAFGVVKVDEGGFITDFIEKPQDQVSDLAIIGIYYFKEGEKLKQELQYLIDNKVMVGGEYQLTDALENMKSQGMKFTPSQVSEWLDFGNKNATINSNARYLDFLQEKDLVHKSASIQDSVIIPPVYIGKNAVLKNSVVGPYVSIGANSSVSDSRAESTIIQDNSKVEHANLYNSMIGNNVILSREPVDLSIGDFNTLIG